MRDETYADVFGDNLGKMLLTNKRVRLLVFNAAREVIITLNLKDFPAATLAIYEITTIKPDDFLCLLYAQNPTKVCEAVRNQRSMLKNPPKTVEEHMATLNQNGLPDFVAVLSAHVGDI